MNDAFIVAALRTPVGRRGGGLAVWHPADLLGHLLEALLNVTDLDAALVDDVIVGCVSQSGAQSFNIARTALLTAGFPESVPGTTVDRQCGSSQQAVHFAAQGVMSGAYDLAIAAGVEVMSAVPILANWTDGASMGHGEPLAGKRWLNRYGEVEISQFNGAELLAQRFGLQRDALDEFALNSHQRAAAAWDAGRFAEEIVPVNGVFADEGFRRDTSREKLAGLKTLRDGGRITAGTSSQISDGASALLIASERIVQQQNLEPIARISAMTVVGSDPVVMLDGPISATRKVLARAALQMDDIGLFEINEAFASVPLAWAEATGAPLDATNVNGGAIALGHPLGATGGRLMTTLVHEMRRRKVRYGLQTMCEGGGMANATVLELVG
jgi:acetyl-CoA C-acetyltransferase